MKILESLFISNGIQVDVLDDGSVYVNQQFDPMITADDTSGLDGLESVCLTLGSIRKIAEFVDHAYAKHGLCDPEIHEGG